MLDLAEYHIKFDCELLEDMHSGTGLGHLGLVDDQQARDAQGRPVVWNSTLAGLLRNVADELQKLGHNLATPERIGHIFGSEGSDARSNLICRSLHFSRPEPSDPGVATQDLPDFLVVASTTREVHSRRPLDGTLRSIELAAAGLKARGEIRLFGDEEDVKLVELCLRRLSSLGGGKTRGMGQIRLSNLRSCKVDRSQEVKLTPKSAGRLRLLLENLEPVCVTTTGHPGNIIETETYLPGQALRGAWLTAFTKAGAPSKEDVDGLATTGVQFSNGYFVGKNPKDATAQDLAELARSNGSLLQNWQSIPLPLSAEEAKPTEPPGASQGSPEVPWWSINFERLERDALRRDKDDDAERDSKEPKFKRVKTADYLVTDPSGNMRRQRPDRIMLQRNRIPVKRAGRAFDSRWQESPTTDEELEAKLKEKSSLFSQESLAENQFFLADVRFENVELAKNFVRLASGHLVGELEHRAWLRIGRGGRPMQVAAWHWMPDEPPKNGDENRTDLTLTLTSDLIARADDLGFLTDLDPAALAPLVGVSLGNSEHGEIKVKKRNVETWIVHGFNTAAGTRRHPAQAIARGSAFLISGSGKAFKDLFAALKQRESCGQGLGERKEEGFGRFMLNHAWHDKTDASQKSEEPRPREAEHSLSAAAVRRESAIEAAMQAIGDLNLAKLSKDKQFPSRGQWQQLRHMVEACSRQDDLDRVMNDLVEHKEQRSGKMWACGKDDGLIVKIDRLRKQHDDFAAQRTFLIHIARWVVIELDRRRREGRHAQEEATGSATHE